MAHYYYISINQLAAFSNATSSAKKRIIKQQIVPNKLLIPWYQSAKSSIRKFLSDVKDVNPINEGIKILETKKTENQRQILDKKVSIEALKKVTTIKIPQLLQVMDYQLIFSQDKSIQLNNVEIKVAPDIVVKGKYKDKIVYGAIKLHVCKNKPFDLKQAEYVSALLYNFLINKIVRPGEEVVPELCLCLDVFGERFVSVSSHADKELIDIKKLCEEIKDIWNSL